MPKDKQKQLYHNERMKFLSVTIKHCKFWSIQFVITLDQANM